MLNNHVSVLYSKPEYLSFSYNPTNTLSEPCDKDNKWDELKVKLGLKPPCIPKINVTPVLINTTRKNYFNNTPFYTVDIYSNVENDYSELNEDKTVIKTVTKYYYYKLLENFLLTDMNDLLGYLKVSGNSVHFIKSKKEYSNKLSPEKIEEMKILFLEENFLTKKMIYNIIKKYVNKHNVAWYKIQNDEKGFKSFLHQELKKLFEEQI